MPRPRKPASPFRYFNSSIRLVVMMYVRFPLSLRNVEDLLFERGIDICHETVRHWWNRFGPLFASDICRQRVSRMRGFRHWRWLYIQWVHSYVTDDKIYCLYRAPSEDLIRKHAEAAGFPANSIAQVRATIDPTTAE